MRTIDDVTPLNGRGVDVAVRIGWIVRMARITTRDGADTRLQTMATRLGSSAAHLSRVETGQRRDSNLITRYESALALADGALWAPIAVLCRAFPRQCPRDSGAVVGETDVHQLSQLTSRLLNPADTVTGSDWLRWARCLSLAGNIGLTVELFARIATRLVSELVHSVSHAHPTRYEALALLRCSHYGDVVLDVIRTAFDAADLRGRTHLASVIGEAVTPEAVKWSLQLLSDETTAFHGALTLETMGQVADTPFWDELTTPLLTLFDVSSPGSLQELWVTHLIRIVPLELWRAIGATPSRPLPSMLEADAFERTGENPLWAWCTAQADEITEPLGVNPQPLLARLLFEIAFGTWESRALTSQMLLTAVPSLSSSVAHRLAAFAHEHPDSPLRERVLRRLGTLVHAGADMGAAPQLDDLIEDVTR